MRHIRLGFWLVCAFTIATGAAHADLTTRPANTWVTGPRTRAVVRAGERLFVGGSFTSVYPASLTTGWLATFDPGMEAARALPALSGGYSGVTALADDGAGGWYAAGDFTRVGATGLAISMPTLVRIRLDGTVQQLSTYSTGEWYTSIAGLARSGNTLFVVFQRNWSVLRWTYVAFHLAAFDAATGLHRGSDVPLGSAFPASAVAFPAIAADSARAYVFGTFTDIAGATRTNAAAFDATTLALTPWAPVAPAGIRTAHVGDATVFVAGNFSQVAGLDRAGLAAFSVADGSLQPWAPTAPCAMSAMAATADRVYLGGCVTATATAEGLVLAVDRSTGASTGWSAITDGPVRSMAVTGSTLYIGGQFTTVAGESRLNVASFTDGVLTSWNPRPSEAVAAVVATPEDVAIGGEFTGLSAVPRPGIAEFDVGTGSLMPWVPPLLTRAFVSTLATDGRWLFILGNLEGPSACLPRCGMLAMSLDGSTTIPVPDDLWGFASVATARDRLYLGSLEGVIGIDTSTGRLLPWRAPVEVWGPMLATEEYIYATPPSSISPTRTLTKIDARNGQVVPWAPGDIPPVVLGLAKYGSLLLVGRVSTLDDRSVLVAVDQATGAVVAEAPRSLVPTIDYAPLVHRASTGPMVTPRGILLSSNATIIGVQPSGNRIPWSLDVDGSVFALCGDERGVVVAGDFVRAGGVVSPGLAILPERVPPSPTGLSAETSGGSVRLDWTRPPDGDPVEYRLEAGTVPGAIDIGAWTLPPVPSYGAAGVPDGRYFVRVRAATGAGVGPPSNEVELIVGTPQPLAPTGLAATVDERTVSLTWSRVAGPVDQYVLDVGSSPGQSNLVRNAPLGLTTVARFDNVLTGTYYARVRAINRTGSSPPSGEVTVVVGGSSAQRTR